MNDAESREQLEVYLKDHYAAGVGALELIRHSRKSHEGTPWAAFFAELEIEVEADHEQLHYLIQALGLDDSGVRNAGAWMAEKLGRAKLGFAGGDTSELRLLQTLESLALGIKGKQLLWRALAAVRDLSPHLQKTDFKLLESRALAQLDRVEAKRLEAAQGSLGR